MTLTIQMFLLRSNHFFRCCFAYGFSESLSSDAVPCGQQSVVYRLSRHGYATGAGSLLVPACLLLCYPPSCQHRFPPVSRARAPLLFLLLLLLAALLPSGIYFVYTTLGRRRRTDADRPALVTFSNVVFASLLSPQNLFVARVPLFLPRSGILAREDHNNGTITPRSTQPTARYLTQHLFLLFFTFRNDIFRRYCRHTRCERCDVRT